MALIPFEGNTFGIVDPKPLKFAASAGRTGFPKGKVRIRLRPTEWARVFVKTSDGIRVFVPKEENGQWVPFVEQGRNIR